jgi:hypothetical protein
MTSTIAEELAMVRFNRLMMVAIVLSASAALGCGTRYFGSTRTPAVAVPRASFDELGTMGPLGVKPLSFAGTKFRTSGGEIPEEEAFSGKSAEKRASWEADKTAMKTLFAEMVGKSAGAISLVPMAEGGATPEGVKYVVESVVMAVDPGFFATSIINAEAYARVHCRVVRLADNAVIYEWDETETNGVGVASGTRMRGLAIVMGMDVFRVIRSFEKAELATLQQ